MSPISFETPDPENYFTFNRLILGERCFIEKSKQELTSNGSEDVREVNYTVRKRSCAL